MGILRTLAEGTQVKDMRKVASALEEKWDDTGLLEGLEGRQERENMSILLENETKQLLYEASTMAGGDVEGFSSVAFPLVRRVFGRTIANKVVTVQPMSLPAGLIFFLDFTHTNSRLDYSAGESIYGQGVVGRQLQSGANVIDDGTTRYGESSFYAQNTGYSSATGSISGLSITEVVAPFEVGNSRTNDATYLRSDPDLESGSYATVIRVTLTSAQKDQITGDVPIDVTLTNTTSGSTQVRRLTKFDKDNGNPLNLWIVYHATASFGGLADDQTATIAYTRKDPWNTPHLGAIVGTSPWELESQAEIPEIDIKVDSIPVTAEEKKLKAKWTPELAQDLNAFHSIDAEVELTSILADQVELEINAEILGDLIKGATGGVYYWSRRPGQFVNRTTGADISSTTAPPDFTGNISEWYQSLLEVVSDLSAQIYRKVLKGGANFIVTSPEVCSILSMTAGFVSQTLVDDDTSDAGILNVGKVNKVWDVYCDPYFPRNIMLVGRKGSGFLESGYVYAPYVPLQTTPVVYGPEDFVPRRAVLTRYAKELVRPDFYGIVVVQDLLS